MRRIRTAQALLPLQIVLFHLPALPALCPFGVFCRCGNLQVHRVGARQSGRFLPYHVVPSSRNDNLAAFLLPPLLHQNLDMPHVLARVLQRMNQSPAHGDLLPIAR